MTCDKVTEKTQSEDRGSAPVKRRIIHHNGQMWSLRCPGEPGLRETSLQLLEELDHIEIIMIVIHGMLVISTMWARDFLVFRGARRHKEIIYTSCISYLTFKVALFLFRRKLRRFL